MMKTQQNSDPELARVRTATLEDLPGIVRLMNSIFGPQKQNEEVFTRWIEDGRFSVGVALSSKEEIIGVSTWYTKPAQELTNFEVFGSSAMEFIKDKLAASVLNLAIHPDHRKQGLAKKLSRTHATWLVKQKADIVLACSWDNGSSDNSQHLLSKNGFTKLGESRDFYRLQMPNGGSCRACNSPDCQCNSILFGADVSAVLNAIELPSQ